MPNWGGDFWGAYADVAKAQAAQALFQQQMQGRAAFGRALQDPGIFMPGDPSGGGAAPGGGAPGGAAPMGGPPGDMSREMNAISGIESGGRYNAMGPRTRTGDRAYGKYQVMGANIPKWTAAAGQAETPQQFLADANMQDKVFKQQFGANEQKYGPQGAASVWFTGRPNAPNARDVNGTTGNQYVQRFTQLMGQTPQNVVQTAQAIGGRPAGQMTWQHIVQALVSRNPGIDPGVLSQAVELFQPLMSQQSQLDWREQSLALREMALTNLERHQGVTEQQGDTRLGLQAGAEAGRNARAASKEAGVQKRFDVTQDRLAKGFDERVREFTQKAQTAKTKDQRDYALRQAKYMSDKRHQRVMEIIGAANANVNLTDEQKAAVAAENAKYEQEKASIQQGSSGDAAPGSQPAGDVQGKAASPASAPAKKIDTSGAPQVFQDETALTAAISKGKVPVGSTFKGDDGLHRFKGGDPLDLTNWELVAPAQQAAPAAPSKPFIDTTTPSGMGKPVGILQGLFGNG